MLRLSNLADYAVLACTTLARAEGRVSAADLSERTGVPGPTMAKLAGTLTRAGLMISTRGASGGVLLAREPADISLADIIEAVDGPIGLVGCVHDRDSGKGEDCQLKGSCRVQGHWPTINARVRGALEDVTLAELAADIETKVETHVKSQGVAA